MDKNDILDYVTETPGNTNRAVLGSMLESFAGGGGSSLPSVTSDDNGKVLTVVEGAWDKAEASGGGGNFIVTVEAEMSGSTPTITSIDKTLDDVLHAVNSGQIVLARLVMAANGGNSFANMSLAQAFDTESMKAALFEGMLATASGTGIANITVFGLTMGPQGYNNLVMMEHAFE